MKQSKGSMILAIVLGVLVILGISGNVFFFVSGKVSALRQDASSQGKGASSAAQSSGVGANSVEGNVGDFTVKKSRMPSLSSSSSSSRASSNSEYLCSYSSTRLLTVEDIDEMKKNAPEGLPVGMIQMVINEMYARKGFRFGKAEIQEYFEKKSWYRSISNYTEEMDIAEGRMSEIEKKNLKTLAAHRE